MRIPNKTKNYKLKISSLKQTHKLPSVDATYKKFVKGMKGAPPVSTFRVWVDHGMKFATFAGAGEHGPQSSIIIRQLIFLIGSIYLLMLIAAKHKRAVIGHLRFHEVDAICNAIHWPDPGIILSSIPFS